MSNLQMTTEDLNALKEELRQLETEARPEVIERIKTAREWGDLKENAEYAAAKSDQSHLETRILKLRERIQNAELVLPPSSSEQVAFGATVTFVDERANREQTFRIVASHEAKPTEGTLSIASPIATALAGRKVGDTVTVQTPSGSRPLRILAIS